MLKTQGRKSTRGIAAGAPYGRVRYLLGGPAEGPFYLHTYYKQAYVRAFEIVEAGTADATGTATWNSRRNFFGKASGT